MRHDFIQIALLIASGSVGITQAATITQTLGASALFADGSTSARVSTWNAATSGNSAPFNNFNGSDTSGTSFAATWQFGYGSIATSILSATITIGIYDIDSAAIPQTQVASFMEGSNDLTSLLAAMASGLHGGTGAVNNEYDIFTITLPGATFVDLLAGSPSFTLSLQGPGLGALGNTTSNGAGIDFSTISITTQDAIPEPSTWALLLGGIGGLAGYRKLRRL